MIVELLKHGVAPREVLAFGVAVESDVGAGVPAEESAVFRLRAIESAVNGGVSATSAFGQDADLAPEPAAVNPRQVTRPGPSDDHRCT